MVHIILLVSSESGILLFFSPAFSSISVCRVCFSVFPDVCIWQTFPIFFFFFFWCDFSFQTICWRGLESTQWLQEETRSPPLKTLQEVKQRSPTVSSVLSFLWWDFCHFYWLDLTVHTAKILFLLTCWYSVKAYWMESEGLYSFCLPTQLFSSLLSPSYNTT